MTARFSLILLLSTSGILLLAGISYLDLTPGTFTLQTSPADSPHTQPGVTINLPPVVAPVDDGQRYYYVQVNLSLELDRSGTAGVI